MNARFVWVSYDPRSEWPFGYAAYLGGRWFRVFLSRPPHAGPPRRGFVPADGDCFRPAITHDRVSV